MSEHEEEVAQEDVVTGFGLIAMVRGARESVERIPEIRSMFASSAHNNMRFHRGCTVREGAGSRRRSWKG